ncbi:MAG: hypothetical protein K6V73_00225 [Firmicutes bacterium]|jgi:hypothetical protein|nr:hypothetical protein [Bacillota bacterium]
MGGSLIPLAQEFEDTFLIVGAALCTLSLAFRGRAKVGLMGTGGLIFLVTLIVTVATFRAGSS